MQGNFYLNSAIQSKFTQFQAQTINFQPNANNSPQIFVFSGNAFSVKQKAEQMSSKQDHQNQYKSLRINITGAPVQAFNFCCYITTIIIGAIFLFPLFFICCNWWKKKVFQLFKIDSMGYQGVCQMITSSGAEQLYLMIQDNYFNQINALDIQNALTKSRIRNFVFTNVATGIDVQGKNFSNFGKYMKPIKNLVYRTEIKWASQIV